MSEFYPSMYAHRPHVFDVAVPVATEGRRVERSIIAGSDDA